MKVINLSKNTLYVDDIDEYIPYHDGEIEDIPPDTLKKSQCLRTFILNGMLQVVEYDKDERIESSLMYLKRKLDKDSAQKEQKQEVIEPPPLISDTDELEVKIHGLFYDAGGYSKVNRNLALKLHQAGLKVRIDPKKGQNQLNADELEPLTKLETTPVSKNYILIDSIVPSFAEVSSARYKVLYTTIESYTIPKQFLDCCSLYDEIWLTSPFGVETLKKYFNDKPIYLVPAGVDQELYTEVGPRFDFRPNVKDFIFLSVFSWTKRKGYDVLLKAYFDEFSAKDNVSLLIMSRFQSGLRAYHRNKIKSDIDEIMNGFPNKDLPHVVRYSDIVAERDMPKMYRAADAFILTSRGEGSGLPPVEASLCGLPIIITNVSGQRMYARSDNSYLIEMDHLIKIPHNFFGIHYWDGQEFPALTSDFVHNQVRQTMRRVYDNPAEGKELNKKMQKFLLENFTWNHTANAAIERLRKIHSKMRK